MFLKVLEFAVAFLALMALVTQVMIPLARNQKLFPLFRKTATLEKEYADAVSEQADQSLTKATDAVRLETLAAASAPKAE
jgi:hypothetical protein